MKEPFEQAKGLLSQLHDHGFQAYYVGGAIRDFYLDKEVHDIDIATSAMPEHVQVIFPITVPVGIEHGTVIVQWKHVFYEVTTFRREAEYKDFRHPSDVEFVDSLYQDLQRRDFTMNAMAMTIDGQIIDPYGGEKDIQSRVIRTVGNPYDRFQEDPLRMMRAFRFLSQLDFNLDGLTLKAIQEMSYLIREVSMERVRQEFDKLLSGQAVVKALKWMASTNFMQQLPLFDASHGDQYLQLEEPMFRELNMIEERWTFLLLFLNLQPDDQVYQTWKFTKNAREKVKRLFKINREMSKEKWTTFAVYYYGLQAAISFVKVKSAINNMSSIPMINQINQLYNSMPIKTRSDIQITGHDLIKWVGQTPGPWVNGLYIQIEKNILDHQLLNSRNEIRRWVIQWSRYNKDY